jgi:hypothetical protein
VGAGAVDGTGGHGSRDSCRAAILARDARAIRARSMWKGSPEMASLQRVLPLSFQAVEVSSRPGAAAYQGRLSGRLC